MICDNSSSRVCKFVFPFHRCLFFNYKLCFDCKERPRPYKRWPCSRRSFFSSHGLLPSGLVAQSVERRRSNPKVVGSIPTLVRVFLCPCVGPFPSVGLTLTWFIWDRNLALHITLYSVNSVLIGHSTSLCK